MTERKATTTITRIAAMGKRGSDWIVVGLVGSDKGNVWAENTTAGGGEVKGEVTWEDNNNEHSMHL